MVTTWPPASASTAPAAGALPPRSPSTIWWPSRGPSTVTSPSSVPSHAGNGPTRPCSRSSERRRTMDDSSAPFFEAAENVGGPLGRSGDGEAVGRPQRPAGCQRRRARRPRDAWSPLYIHHLLDGPEGGRRTDRRHRRVPRQHQDGIDFDADLHRYIRDKDERSAAHGPERTIGRFHEMVAESARQAAGRAGRRVLEMRPIFPWAISLRGPAPTSCTMDLVVHADDLAVSIGRPGGEAPEAASSVAIDGLVAAARFAARRPCRHPGSGPPGALSGGCLPRPVRRVGSRRGQSPPRLSSDGPGRARA